MVAAEWVNLLRHGVLDVDVYADKAAVIIDMLWSAAGHASPKVPFVKSFSHSSIHLFMTPSVYC